MILVAASLVAGLGLLFVGLYFLTEHLKTLSGRRLSRPLPMSPSGHKETLAEAACDVCF